MRHWQLLVTSLCTTALIACGAGNQRASKPAYHAGGASHTTSSYDSGGASEPGGPRGYDSPESVPAERPGLGTEWGETLHSRVQTRSFIRASSSPFAAVAIHYNDADGVAAQTRYLGSYSLQPLRAYTPAGGISVALVDERGNLLPGGHVSGRNLVVGHHGARYNIVIENRTGGRYEIVTSVDGLDVIDGRPANTSKRGYILDPHTRLVIDGFRQSDSAVAAFRFGRVSESYAARTSGDRNVGVIGVAMFAEQGSAWTTDELHKRDTADPFPGNHGYARPPSYR